MYAHLDGSVSLHICKVCKSSNRHYGKTGCLLCAKVADLVVRGMRVSSA